MASRGSVPLHKLFTRAASSELLGRLAFSGKGAVITVRKAAMDADLQPPRNSGEGFVKARNFLQRFAEAGGSFCQLFFRYDGDASEEPITRDSAWKPSLSFYVCVSENPPFFSIIYYTIFNQEIITLSST